MRREVTRPWYSTLRSMVLASIAIIAVGTAILFHVVHATLPVEYSLTSISTGVSSCAIGNGKVYCWGYNNYGQLGDGTTNNSSIPLDVEGLLAGKTASMISNGYYHTCAVADNTAYCWGTGAAGRLGDNAIADSHVPVAVVDSNGLFSGKTITEISASSLGSHTCAIAGGAASCWGFNTNGQIGNNSTTEVHVPTAVDTSGVLAGKTVTDISAGQSDTCAVASGAAYCWGLNSSGQLGNNSITESHVPVAVDTSGVLAGKTVTAISASGTHTCAIADNEPYCWGNNANGRLGNNSTTDSLVPVAVDTSGVLAGKTVTAIAAAGSGTCAIANGADYCWGLSSNGQNGNNSTASSLVPIAVDTSGVLAGKTVTAISTGSSTNCAIADGQAFCWGKNNYGQLGNNTITTQSNVPVAVSMASPLSYGNSYRLYNNADSVTPGSPLAATNQPAQLASSGDAFRLRTGVTASSVTVNANSTTYVLQYAAKTAATCSVQSGFTNVTATSAIAWNTNTSVTDHTAITSTANDPTISGTIVYESYSASSGSTIPNTITPGQTGLWDFSLRDNSNTFKTSYCLRLAQVSGTGFDSYTAYPEIETAPGDLSLTIVNNYGVPVANPSFALSEASVQSTCQTTTGYLGTVDQQFRVTNNIATNGWTLSVAATDGATALWNSSDNSQHYDYNDPSGSPAGCNSGSDGDGFAGQLSIRASQGQISYQPATGCSNPGISYGEDASFNQGTTDAITMMTASSSASMYCYFGRLNMNLSQTIPGNQPPGTYTLDLTATVVAQ